MNFELTEPHEAVRDLARQILADAGRDRWAELAKANLLGIAVPEEDGGSGLGLFELCLVLEEVGRSVAPLPVFPTLVAALAIGELGSTEQRGRWLPGVVAGDTVLTVALTEPLNPDARRPATVARDGRIDGVKLGVPFAADAQAALIPASMYEDTTGLFLVELSHPGVTVEALDTTNGEPQSKVTFAGVPGDRVGGDDAVGWILDRATAGLYAMQVGVCERALRMTAEYTSGREQFGKPIAAFQAVAQRAADAYIDLEGIRLTALQAAWRLGEGLPAANELLVAKYWATEAAQRVVHAAHHLHGGIGVDTDYGLHHSFLWAKQLELTLGSAGPTLARLGALLADEPV